MADYCTKDEAKAQAAGKTGAGSDTLIAALVTAASRTIDRVCNRPDGFVAPALGTARTYAGRGKAWLRIDECAAVPSLVEVKDSATAATYTPWTASDWLIGNGDPENPEFNRTPYTLLLVDPTGSYSHFTSGRRTFLAGFRPDPDSVGRIAVPTVRVTARWGYATVVPDAIKQACIIQTVRWLKRSEGSWADTLMAADSGQLLFRQEMDPDLKLILVRGGYVRVAI